MSPRKMVHLALLVALSLILFTVENAFPPPLPIPGARVGLANIVIVWCIYHYSAKETSAVLAARVILSAVISGRMGSVLFSASGAIASFALGAALRHIIPISRLWLCSALCGAAHNTGQLAAVVAVTRSTALAAYLPFLILSGTAAGSLTGLAAQWISTRFSAK